MDVKLLLHAISKYLLGLSAICCLLFTPAGTINYWNGWLFIGLLFVPMLILGIVLILKNPELLKKRLIVKENEKEQKYVTLFSFVMFLFGFIIAGLNYKYKWTEISNVAVIISSILFLLSYILYAEVLRENTFLSRRIEVDINQKVIDNGLYGIVRHPMYSSTIIMFLSIPIILGSFVSFIIFLLYPFIIRKRIINEEKLLEKELNGYKDYKNKVKYRLIPFIW